jgi:DNA repair exonuclease SbcCD ATPase subunit
MILFEKIRWKNFLSTGNQFTEINFQKNSTTLIIGSNGTGKSTVLDALTFVLFSKSFRGINKPQIVNSTNEKDCLVEIEFTIGSIKWKVRRGIKPNIFEIYKNNKLVDQNSSSIDQQKWFEQSILKMNYKSFTQIVILGSSNFIPFMQLSASSRREVIEDLLDIKIFSSMGSIIKEKVRQNKEEIRTLELKKESLKEKLEMQKKFIEDVENQGKENIERKKITITNLLEECNNFSLKNSQIGDQVFSLTKNLEEVSGATEKLKKLGNLKGKISQKVSTITNEHKFFNKNTVCPTCTQEIDEEFRLNKISEAKSKAKELQSGYEELERAIKDEEIRENNFLSISKEITNLNHEISQNNTRVFANQRQMQDLEIEIQTIINQIQNKNIEHQKLEIFERDLENVFSNLSSKKELVNYYDFSYGLLKDSGVKSKIIKKYLPLINKQVNRYLQMMDFYINFTLDEEFSETIQSPIHEDFSYSSFSEGEKQRIDLALLFTWREVAKFKNSTNTNLLIMDEVFDSSLDGYGTEEFLKIIRYVIKDANIFVISHKIGLEDRFESVIKFEKRKNFSYIIQ